MDHNFQRAALMLARKQQGNVTRVQLLALGLGPGLIKSWIRKGLLHRVHRGVYGLGRPPYTPVERASAAVLACAPTGALSHGSSMALWGIWRQWDLPYEVSVTVDRRPSDIRVHLTRTLHRRDVRTHLGLRTTSLARALFDVAPRLSDEQLFRAIHNALVSPWLGPAQLAELLDRHPRDPRTPRIAEFIPQAKTGPTRSELEREFLAFCARFGLPTPKLNAIVNGYEVDAYFERERVIVELDGWEFHSTRLSFEKDRNRDVDNLARGLITVRITAAALRKRPVQTAERLKRILASRA
jgi:hypothetical protein